MGKSYMTIMVLNLPPAVTAADVETFFWCCGNTEKVQLQREEDGSQWALVTFKQPFAFKMSLLLDEAVLGDQSLHVLPLMASDVDNQDGGRSQKPIQTLTLKTNDDDVAMDWKGYASDRLVKLIREVMTMVATNPYVATAIVFISGLLYRAVMRYDSS